MRGTIILTAGGTGGHVFPALCVAEGLMSRGHDVIIVTDIRGTKYISEIGCRIVVQKIRAHSGRFALLLSIIMCTLKATIELILQRPAVVVSFGGYQSVPYTLSAQILGRKTVVHEQNAVIGRANKLLSKMATKVLTSFPKTIGLNVSDKIVVVGNPTRYDRKFVNAKPPTNEIFKILVFGGSQGAKLFSEHVVDALCQISKTRKIEVFHQGRDADIASIKARYEAHQVKHSVSSFFDNMNKYYEKADLVISRSGASSVFEIIGFKKPSILVPYKMSVNGDQEANANFLGNRGAAVVITEDRLNDLSETIKELTINRKYLATMAQNLRDMQVCNATDKCVAAISELCCN
ncbi:MAG: undecaprenyldiphospho-muramoylpentapeptide beta-N-acetylglucosaminyltransferase [Holosporales bacterium]|jgi:UDP-N-acetylglucosamine--N-acetylmuramyl-(pentapeptide) pyrophosphoryl-undecaprenol N-acetylglucosamine transferase|nr:undecaprenyldiphospho-muramoylpentapeptide beta-N-acetylglucosaminyltransferase [Holosporales bacterium]